MSWNNGYERRKFEQAQKAQAKEYRQMQEERGTVTGDVPARFAGIPK